MEKLDNKDLERFGWDKISPGIYKKIKKKKRKILFFKIMKMSAVPILLLLGFWLIPNYDKMVKSTPSISLKTTDAQPKNENGVLLKKKDIGKKENVLERSVDKKISENSASKKLDKTNPLYEIAKESKSSSTVSTSFFTPSKFKSTISEEEVNDIHTIILNEPIKNTPLQDFKSKLYNDGAESPQKKIELSINNSEFKNALENYTSEGKEEKLLNKRNNPSQDEAIKADQEIVIECAPLPITISHLQSIKEGLDLFPSIEIQRNKNNFSNAIELGLGLNTITRHPDAQLPGVGISLGFIYYLNESHYLGLEYDAQRYRYRFNYPEDIIVPGGKSFNDNKHDIYSVPVFYGYQFNRNRFQISLETGISIALIKFSSGEISSINNANAILNIQDGNYFKKNIGASWLTATKLNYPIGKNNFSLFTRVSAQLSFNNWYINEEKVIKPLMINIDLGVKKTF